jgi:hypothetical protein
MDITINLNLTIRDERTLNALLTRVEQKLDAIAAQEKTQMDAITALQAEVARNTTVEKSALTLIQGLHDQIVAAGTDPAALKAITDQLAANDDELVAAIVRNTPAAQPEAAQSS